MTKRDITVFGIALILLIAIGITIALDAPKATPGPTAALQPRTLGLKTLGLKQASLALPLTDESPAAPKKDLALQLKPTLKTSLKTSLKPELKPELKVAVKTSLKPESKTWLKAALKPELKSLTASASKLKTRPDDAGRLPQVASLSAPCDKLKELLTA